MARRGTAERAQAIPLRPTIVSDRMGLAFWGMVEDAPARRPPPSRTSAISLRARSMTSRAIRLMAAASTPRAAASAAKRSRMLCQGSSSQPRPRISAACRRVSALSDP